FWTPDCASGSQVSPNAVAQGVALSRASTRLARSTVAAMSYPLDRVDDVRGPASGLVLLDPGERRVPRAVRRGDHQLVAVLDAGRGAEHDLPRRLADEPVLLEDLVGRDGLRRA